MSSLVTLLTRLLNAGTTNVVASLTMVCRMLKNFCLCIVKLATTNLCCNLAVRALSYNAAPAIAILVGMS